MCLSDCLQQCLLSLTSCVASLLFDTLQSANCCLLYSVLQKTYLKLRKPAVTESQTTELRCHSRVHYQCCTGLLWLIAVSFNTGNYHALVSKTIAVRETLRNKLRDAGTHSFHFEQL